MGLLSVLNSDSYKQFHHIMYPDGITKLYSNGTPRSFKHLGCNKAVFFGLQYYIKKYLIEDWNKNFFDRDLDSIVKEYKRFHKYFSGTDVTTEHIAKLHKLGYMPVEIKALPEGSLVGEKIPFYTIINTHDDFAWLVNFLETQMSAAIWHPTVVATIGRMYRELLNKWAIKTTGSTDGLEWQGHDFSMRGLSTLDAVISNQMGWLLSFNGTDSIPAVYGVEKYYNGNIEKELIGASVPACYDNKTEILTNKGWKLFKDLDKTETVAQYNSDGTIEFVLPTEYFKDRYKGKLIGFSKKKGYNYIDAVVTPNHKMIRKKEDGTIDFFEAGDFSYQNRNGYSGRNSLIVSGKIKNSISGLSACDKLKIAFQADGSFPSHKEDYTGEKGKGFPIRFSLKKKRKKERLESLLIEAGFSYTINQYDNGYYSFWINTTEPFVKDLSWVDLSSMSIEQCVDFINELQYWDGSIKNNCIVYTSTNKSCIDIIQGICAISGYKTKYSEYIDNRGDYNRKLLYTLTIEHKEYVGGRNIVRELVDYDDYVYCVSVPSKKIVVRRNNVVLVCGNTEHSVMTSYGKESEIDAFRRILSLFPSGIVSIVSDSFDLWKVCTTFVKELKNEILSRDGKLVIRPDSGDPVDIICGDGFYQGSTRPAGTGVVELLWRVFGGTINDKGYKVLDSHIGVIYGDSITLDRANEICKRLEAKGFASTNVVLGVGSYTMQYNTRDSIGFAVKSTWCEVDGDGREIFKDPITDNGLKKSAKGLLCVLKDENGEFYLKDQCTKEEESLGELKTVYKDGVLIKDLSFNEIKNNLNK